MHWLTLLSDLKWHTVEASPAWINYIQPLWECGHAAGSRWDEITPEIKSRLQRVKRGNADLRCSRNLRDVGGGYGGILVDTR